MYDKSETGTQGLTLDDVGTIPEFSGHSMVMPVAEYYMDKESLRLYPENFIYFIAALSSRSSAERKRDCKLLFLTNER